MLLKSETIFKFLQRGLLLLAALCLVVFIAIWINIQGSTAASNRFIQDSQSNIGTILTELKSTKAGSMQVQRIESHEQPIMLTEISDWSENANSLLLASEVDSFELQADTGVIAVVNIPSVNIFVPVFKGTTKAILDRGAGLITGTSSFDQVIGNVGIAAHRDSFFRGLKDIQLGHQIQITTKTHELAYSVTDIQIVNPADVHVLYPNGKREITLVTCYPFYFIGKAPKRYIVSAELASSAEI